MPEFTYITDATTQSATIKIALIDVTTNAETPAKTFVPRPDFAPPIAIAPDGKAVAYNIAENGVGNVWLQPLDGSPGRRLTNFNSDRSFTFQFSPDGKSLGLVRTLSQTWSCCSTPTRRVNNQLRKELYRDSSRQGAPVSSPLDEGRS
jgi:Tol biopolymer transport system component